MSPLVAVIAFIAAGCRDTNTNVRQADAIVVPSVVAAAAKPEAQNSEKQLLASNIAVLRPHNDKVWIELNTNHKLTLSTSQQELSVGSTFEYADYNNPKLYRVKAIEADGVVVHYALGLEGNGDIKLEWKQPATPPNRSTAPTFSIS